MPKPPKATPHSDIDGVHKAERPNTDVAAEIGDSSKELEDARIGNAARPPYSDDEENEDNRAS